MEMPAISRYRGYQMKQWNEAKNKFNKYLSTLTHYPYIGDEKIADGVEVVEGVDYVLQLQVKTCNGWKNQVYNVMLKLSELPTRIVAIGIPKPTVQVEKTCVHCFEFIAKHKIIGLDCPTAIPGIWKKTQFSTTEPISEKKEEPISEYYYEKEMVEPEEGKVEETQEQLWENIWDLARDRQFHDFNKKMQERFNITRK